MPIYKSTEYNKYYSGSLCHYYSKEPNSGAVGNISYSIKDSKSFNCKISIKGELEGKNTEKVKIFVPVKYLSNFWRTLDMSLINCELFLILVCLENSSYKFSKCWN